MPPRNRRNRYFISMTPSDAGSCIGSGRNAAGYQTYPECMRLQQYKTRPTSSTHWHIWRHLSGAAERDGTRGFPAVAPTQRHHHSLHRCTQGQARTNLICLPYESGRETRIIQCAGMQIGRVTPQFVNGILKQLVNLRYRLRLRESTAPAGSGGPPSHV